MIESKFKELLNLDLAPSMISVSDLKNQEPRTLLYGYTCERDTHHVYLENGEIHLLVYQHDGVILRHEQRETFNLDEINIVPDKRLYPETCDYEFCKLLKERNVHLPFTTFNPERKPETYYGRLA